MAVADSRELSKTRPVPGLQHGFLQLWRRMEGISSQGVAAKHINHNEILDRSDRSSSSSDSVRTSQLRCDREGARTGPCA